MCLCGAFGRWLKGWWFEPIQGQCRFRSPCLGTWAQVAGSRLWSDAFIPYHPILQSKSGVCSHLWCLVLSLSSLSHCEIAVFSRFSLVNLWNISTKESPVFFFQVQRGSLMGAFKHCTQVTLHSHSLISVYRVQMSSFTEQGSGSVSTWLEQEMGSMILRAGLLIYRPWPDASPYF